MGKCELVISSDFGVKNMKFFVSWIERGVLFNGFIVSGRILKKLIKGVEVLVNKWKIRGEYLYNKV